MAEIVARRCERAAAVLRLRESLERQKLVVVGVDPDGVLVRDPDNPAYVHFHPAPWSAMPAHRRIEFNAPLTLTRNIT